MRANHVECAINVIFDFIVPSNDYESRQVSQIGLGDLERDTFVNVAVSR